MSVGKRIKELREQHGMSQVDLADKLNVSKQTLYKYENDIITNIPSDKIEIAAKIFGVSPAYIMGWETSKGETSFANEENNDSSEAKKLLDIIMQLSTEDIAKLRAYIEFLKKDKELEDIIKNNGLEK